MEQIPVTVREWTDILARIRFGTVKAFGKTYSAARIKLVAYRLANYADSDGTRIRPGIARLAVDLEIEYRTARDVIALLRRLGLIHLEAAGAGRGRADEYRLTLPTDLLDRDDLDVWTPTQHTHHTRQLSDRHRGRTTHPRTPIHGPQDGAATDTAPPPARSSRTTETRDARSSRTPAHGPQDLATYQDLDTTPTDQPPLAPRTAVTVTRATTPTVPDRSPRCHHGLTAGRRRDGRPACALCRRIAHDTARMPPAELTMTPERT
ncbi:hypothetical protein GCM10010112_82670 [Actinoplanes lobatus]|uniref:Uncharacterized protein n=1 Tax=Actinoplanes lobatus TaxID=113568 RepID=A0A7W7HLB5_9ACTN|nr:hypothetical protein [Actinoplanes lobatus]MBB4752545.1 hypothetical protein [Actinoplanes lobatus]GGN93894.1 hypothetical protein GCM10010112_82670 [Actinoplanes lobatus]GIE44844.1 hypothetical protein Alo02nite_77420 [Actinoplanes lobatus]